MVVLRYPPYAVWDLDLCPVRHLPIQIVVHCLGSLQWKHWWRLSATGGGSVQIKSGPTCHKHCTVIIYYLRATFHWWHKAFHQWHKDREKSFCFHCFNNEQPRPSFHRWGVQCEQTHFLAGVHHCATANQHFTEIMHNFMLTDSFTMTVSSSTRLSVHDDTNIMSILDNDTGVIHSAC